MIKESSSVKILDIPGLLSLIQPPRYKLKNRGELITPGALINEILDQIPQDIWRRGGCFLDPCCGRGSFLVAMARRLLKYHDSQQVSGMLRGVDIDPWCVYTTRIVLANQLGVPETDIHVQQQDFLSWSPDMRFDVIVGNPPYQSGAWIDFMKKSIQLSTHMVAMVAPTVKADVSSKYAPFRDELISCGLQSLVECPQYFPKITTSTPISCYVIDKNKPGNTDIFLPQSTIKTNICDKVLSFTRVNGGLCQVAGQHGYKDKTATGTITTIMSIKQSGVDLQIKPRADVRIMDNAYNYFFTNQVVGRDANSMVYETTDQAIGINSTVFAIIKPPGYDANKFREVYFSKLMRFVLSTFRGTRITQGWQLAKMPIVPHDVTDLAAYFNLTTEEIDYVESHIK